jgi:hypothetical protein
MNMEEKAPDRTQCRNRFGRSYGPVIRQTIQRVHVNEIRKVAKKPLIVFAIVTIECSVHHCYLDVTLAEFVQLMTNGLVGPGIDCRLGNKSMLH